MTTCPLGYQCPAYSYEEFSYPAQPGDYIDATQTEKECTTGNYCSGAKGAVEACPAGFNTNFGGDTETENYSALACQPNDAGTGCSAGNYCPEAVTSHLPCHPGTFTTATDAKNKDGCVACTAGKFCAENSSSDAGQCPDGSYCPARTIFNEEFGCPAGKTSTGASNPANEAACTNCPVGSWCREGQEETNLCNAEQYVCPSGSAERQKCNVGTYIANPAGAPPADASSCDACVAGGHCSGFGGMKDCRPGYFS